MAAGSLFQMLGNPGYAPPTDVSPPPYPNTPMYQWFSQPHPNMPGPIPNHLDPNWTAQYQKNRFNNINAFRAKQGLPPLVSPVGYGWDASSQHTGMTPIGGGFYSGHPDFGGGGLAAFLQRYNTALAKARG